MRRRLGLLVAATTSVVLLAFLIPLAVLVSRAASSQAISEASASSQAMVSAVASGAGRAEINEVSRALDRSGFSVRVHEPDRVAIAQTTVDKIEGGAARLRQPVVVGDRTVLVDTLIPRSRLREGVLRAWLVLALLGVVLVVLSLAVADRLARSLIVPIGELAGVAHRLSRGDLDQRVTPRGPAELIEVGEALNVLAARIRELLAAERESVADLSHRLRTPITSLRLETESLPSGPDRERLTATVDELARQVDWLIQEARRPARQGVEDRCDAREVVGERVAFWAALAEDQGRSVHLELPSTSMPVRSARADLEAALDALLGNVLAHTPEGTDLTVSVSQEQPGDVLVVVSDEGPGFADAAVLRRGESRAGSTGLGLDIARRAALTSGGELQIDTAPGGGARVAMRLGPPSPRP